MTPDLAPPVRRIAAAALLVLAVLAAAAVAPAAHASPAAAKTAKGSSQLLGVQVLGISRGTTAEQVDADLDAAANMHARMVRAGLDWWAIEPVAGSYDPAVLATADHLFAAARARGIKVLLDPVGTPCWNTTAPAPLSACATQDDQDQAQHFQPRDMDAYGKLVAFAAARWKADLAAIEIWNEPDQANEQYWAGSDKVARYAQLSQIAYKAIKAASRSTTVISGALVGGNGKFLEALYKAGFKGSYDALSVHFYDLALYQLGEIRKVRRQYGDRKPMWLAETGFTSCLPGGDRQLGGHLCVTQANQAKFTLDVLRELHRESDVRAVSVFQLRDDPTYDFGAFDRNGNAKPLFSALRNAYLGHLGAIRRTTLNVRRQASGLVASGGAPAGDVYILGVRVGRTLRYQAAFRLDREGRYALAIPASLGRHGLTVTVRPYTVSRPPVTRRVG